MSSKFKISAFDNPFIWVGNSCIERPKAVVGTPINFDMIPRMRSA